MNRVLSVGVTIAATALVMVAVGGAYFMGADSRPSNGQVALRVQNAVHRTDTKMTNEHSHEMAVLKAEHRRELRKEKREARRAGYRVGQKSGYQEGNNDGYVAGNSAGYSSGHAEGEAEGHADGYAEGDLNGYSDGYDDGSYDSYYYEEDCSDDPDVTWLPYC